MMQQRYWCIFFTSLVLLATIYLLKQNVTVNWPTMYQIISKSEPSVFGGSNSLSGELVFIGDSRIELNSTMDRDEADIAFHKFVSKLHYACPNSIRLGNILDGGWDMCLEGTFRPKQPCLVYSFGINNDFSFDDAVSLNFGCTVRSFDPSMTQNDHQRSANVWFYKLGISGDNVVNSKGWKLRTLSTIIDLMNDTNKTIDYLKMDVETSEWPSLPAMISSGVLSRVKQFGIELHVEIGDWNVPSLYEKYRSLKELEKQGFRRWYSIMNMYNLRKTHTGFRSCCYEVVYINQDFISSDDLL